MFRTEAAVKKELFEFLLSSQVYIACGAIGVTKAFAVLKGAKSQRPMFERMVKQAKDKAKEA